MMIAQSLFPWIWIGFVQRLCFCHGEVRMNYVSRYHWAWGLSIRDDFNSYFLSQENNAKNQNRSTLNTRGNQQNNRNSQLHYRPINKYNMSKKRNSSFETPRAIKLKTSYQSTGPSRYLADSNLQKSWDNLSRRKMRTEALQEDAKLKSIYNKNISKFRDLVNENDRSVLPFISSLRDHVKAKKSLSGVQLPGKTKVQAFQVAEKQTCNQKIQKDMADIKGRTKRVSNTFYRWHNKTGQNIKNNCLFQAKLRETSNNFRNKNTFKNMFKSPKPNKIQGRVYAESQLICSKQRRLFTTIEC